MKNLKVIIAGLLAIMMLIPTETFSLNYLRRGGYYRDGYRRGYRARRYYRDGYYSRGRSYRRRRIAGGFIGGAATGAAIGGIAGGGRGAGIGAAVGGVLGATGAAAATDPIDVEYTSGSYSEPTGGYYDEERGVWVQEVE